MSNKNFNYSTDLIRVEVKLRQGLFLHKSDKLLEAESIYQEILKINPKHFDALQLLGAIALQFKQYDRAIELLNSALKIHKKNASVYNNLAIALLELDRFEEALTSLEKAIKLQKDFSDAYLNLGIVKQKLNLTDEALLNYKKAIELNPNSAKAFSNIGNLLKELGDLEDALSSCDKAIKIDENFAEAFYNKGNILFDLNYFQAALESFEKTIILSPNFAEAFYHYGNTLVELSRLEEAVENYEKAIKINSDLPYLRGTILHTRMRICNWERFETNLQNILLKITQGEKCSSNLSVLAITDSPELQRKASQIWLNDKHPPDQSLGSISKTLIGGKLKIGYFSADFREHPIAYLTAELFELHDKTKLELIAFYFGPEDSSKIHHRIKASFNKFFYVRSLSDKAIAKMSRDEGIDIAVDLTGLTKFNKVGIFSYRAAPIQTSYLGYLGTLANGCYDYLFADKMLIPIEFEKYYHEKIVYLPCYQVNDSKRVPSNRKFTKNELNIPEEKFVFCCFNNNYKITPITFDSWMKILKFTSNSVLFIYSENKLSENNLKLEAEKRGVEPSRLIFCPYIDRGDYLARFCVADLFLDTFPYGAGTTASDALWVGLPVLTRIGNSFASRIAASLLQAIELPELITTTIVEYETRAVDFANNPELLKCIRKKLNKNKSEKALFNTPRFTKNIEAAYIQMYERYQNGLMPTNIYVEE